MQKILCMVILIFVCAAMLALSGCNNTDNNVGTNGSGTGNDTDTVPGLVTRPLTETARPEPTPGAPPPPRDWPLGADLMERRPVALQLEPLTPGEELVILHTNFGDITLRMFPQAAPIAVENFMTLAATGEFDGRIFHRVIPGFMIQGGCSEGTGMGGASIWGTGFGPEHNYDLWHFNGALAAAQTGQANSIGSQFYIVHSDSLDASFTREFEHLLQNPDQVIYPPDWDGTGPHLTIGDVYPREMLEHYLRVGGTPFLDFPFNPSAPNFGHTVFGQVVEGMDVVNAIANTPLVPVAPPDTPSRPVDDVIIERASIVVYGG